jgi:drug/metabolite transporter (DMT)-like permease
MDESLVNSGIARKLISMTPQGALISKVADGAKYGSYLMITCCFISFIIWLGTFVSSYTTKDPNKKKSLKGTWIAFLVLTIISFAIAYYLHTKSTISGIAKTYHGANTYGKTTKFMKGHF